MTYETMTSLQLSGLKSTPILLEMADKSVVKPMGTLEDIVVTIIFGQYPIDFVVISPKTSRPRHPMVLWRPWLATVDAVIGCRNEEMIISNGPHNQTLSIFQLLRQMMKYQYGLKTHMETKTICFLCFH